MEETCGCGDKIGHYELCEAQIEARIRVKLEKERAAKLLAIKVRWITEALPDLSNIEVRRLRIMFQNEEEKRGL